MERVRARERARREQLERRMQEQHASASATQSMAKAAQTPEPPRTVVREAPKVGRNDPCPCGSGLKYKKCCGVAA
jgi:uncharacterized protein YecA (UPF0149 family)